MKRITSVILKVLPFFLTVPSFSAMYGGSLDRSVEKVTSRGIRLHFPEQYYDGETGLHYNWYRYYDPKFGRYLQADPIRLQGGENMYAYVANDPMNLIDVSGLAVGDFNLVDQKLDPETYEMGNHVPVNDGDFIIVVAHGSHLRLCSTRKCAEATEEDPTLPGKPYSVQDIANLVRTSPKWAEGKPVLLWGCSTAHTPYDGKLSDTFAFKLAKELRGVVYAATENIAYRSDAVKTELNHFSKDNYSYEIMTITPYGTRVGDLLRIDASPAGQQGKRLQSCLGKAISSGCE